MISGVIIHRQHVLLGQHVAVSFNPKILLHTLKDGAGLHHVATELLTVASRGRVIDVDLRVNDDTATSKLTNLTSTDANTAATPGHCARSSKCRSREGQQAHLIQVVSHGGVNDQKIHLLTALTQFGASFCNSCSGQVVGFSGRTRTTQLLLKAVAVESSVEQAGQLLKQASSVQLVDGVSQLVTDVKHRVFTSSQDCNVIHGVGKATVNDGCNLGSGADLLRSQIASATGAPGSGAVKNFFRRRHGVELRNLNSRATFTSVKQCITHHSARFDELATFFDCLSHIGAEIIPFYDVRQKDTAGIILKWCGHFLFGIEVCGVQVTDLRWCPTGTIYRPLA